MVQLTLHGILRKDHPGRYGHYLLTDLATNVTYELQGSGLDDLVGASVEVTGTTFDTAAAAGASKVMSVSDIHQMPMSEIRRNTPPPETLPQQAPPTPSGETVPSNAAGPEVGANPKANAPPDANAPQLRLLPPSTTIKQKSSSSWLSQLERLSGWLWAWVVANRRPSARNRSFSNQRHRLAAGEFLCSPGGCSHRKDQDRPCPNRGTREWIVERSVNQDSDHANSPDGTNRRPQPPKGERKHGEPDR